ncbi:MAG TPA: RNA-binding protein [Cytophagales bacterium]|nr:RNA-binding protein [Cytophagales bacterium]
MNRKPRILILQLGLFAAGWGLIGCEEDSARFSLQNPEATGITFSNTITETPEFNILTNEYIYNGGGVALADFNQDGLLDVYFTGNQVNNQLYLNQGNWEFEDITEAAGAAAADTWSSGVSVIDINTDGWPDLYISATMRTDLKGRTNVLFVNQGVAEGQSVPTFKEMAAEYGLADTTHTTQSAFLDYDRDGDLDIFMAVDQVDARNLPNIYRYKKKDGSSNTTDRLYRNEGSDSLGHPYFTNVSAEAGILTEGYSLGLHVTDFNHDGWPDIYVSNDYITNDLVYVNNQDGTFTDRAGEYFKHTSYSAMGNDMADLNNDGRLDLVVLDMLPEDNYRRKTMMPAQNYTTYINNERYEYDYQFVRNTLQLNQGPPSAGGEDRFSEVGIMAGIAATDWSWAPLIADFDLDGDQDLIVTNGFPKDITNLDFGDYHDERFGFAGPEHLLDQIPSVKIANYAFQNEGTAVFTEVTKDWGITEPSFSNGGAYGDLDNDGDLDYIVNNINDAAHVYRNQTLEQAPANWLKVKLPQEDGIGGQVILTLSDGSQQMREYNPHRGYLSSMSATVHFGLGANTTIEKLEMKLWDGRELEKTGVAANQVVEIEVRSAKPGGQERSRQTPLMREVTDRLGIEWEHQERDFIDYNFQRLLPHKLSQLGPGMAVGDVDGNGLDDLFLGGSYSIPAQLFAQQPDGTFVSSPVLEDHAYFEDMGALFFDADGDADLDLYVVSGGFEYPAGDSSYQDRLYLNDGQGNLVRAASALPELFTSGGCVRAADYDQDGDLDLFVGGRVRPHQYPKPVSSYLLRNDSEEGQAQFTLVNEELAPMLNDLGMVCDALFTDVDQDGWVDLLLAGEYRAITFLKNERGTYVDQTEASGLSSYLGQWNSLAAGDFDGDGDTDYVAGNLGKNTLQSASADRPLRLYAKDFDGNAGFDVFPSLYLPNQQGIYSEVPFHNRRELESQVTKLKGRFPRHHDLGVSTMNEVILAEERDDALILEVNHTESSYLENLGDGTFAMTPLPWAAQKAPLFGLMPMDVNADGHLDIIAAGNDYGGELLTGRMDALNGLVLLGDGQGGFTASSLQGSGFDLSGDAKSLACLASASGQPLIFAAENRGPLKTFISAGKYKAVALSAQDRLVEWNSGDDASTHRMELYHGSGYLGQSSRTLFLPADASSVQLTSYQGETKGLE